MESNNEIQVTQNVEKDHKNLFTTNYEYEMADIFASPSGVQLDRAKLPLFLQKYLQITSEITDAQEGARVTAILPALAVNIGNRVFVCNSGNRIFPNVWSVIIGPSTTSRKTTVLNLAKKTLAPFEETLSELESSEYAQRTLVMTNTTVAKLISMLAVNPNRLFVHNELSGFLAEMTKLYNTGMKQTVTDLYDGISRNYFTMEREERIENPALSIMSASTEGWFLSMIGNAQEHLSGFTQRFIYCIINNIELDKLDTSYREGFEHSENLKYLEDIYQVIRSIEGTHRIKLSQQAIDYRNRIFVDKLKDLMAYKTDALNSYFSRIYDGYLFKFCIIFHLYGNIDVIRQFIEYGDVEKFFETCPIELETVEQSMYLCDYYFRNTLPLLNLLSEQGKLLYERKFANLLKSRFDGTASHSQMMQYGHFTAKEMKSIVDTLLEMGVIEMEPINSGKGKKAFRYHLNPKYLK